MQLQQQLGYKLYSLGWRSGLHDNIPRIQHRLLSLFLIYRRGFAAGSEWVEEYDPHPKAGRTLKRTQ